MKTLLITTSLILGLAGASFAQSQETEVGIVKMSESSLLVRDMIGEPVYNFRGRPNTEDRMPLSGLERFERVASIKDVMINTDGTVEALVLSVGGFWGLADREVTAAIDGVSVVTDVRGDKYFVIYAYEETLDNARRFNKFDLE
ncbi:PRC-barrel domain-containing protein [uncultured Sulfitobacter sp.]|uniref:PRC-barrel domain-containing protein n=1 Tax=uncultured Sulfitobacter sp. TaxID=191468 RepID=UPI0026022493|nr:PRC-barrel domain-containing protein [uncultured Sulfitobacter sp.]